MHALNVTTLGLEQIIRVWSLGHPCQGFSSSTQGWLVGWLAFWLAGCLPARLPGIEHGTVNQSTAQ